MKYFSMALHGTPKGWDRSGQNGKFHYDTKKNTEMKASIRILAQTEAEKKGIELPIPAGNYGYEIKIASFFVPPKSTTKKNLALINKYLLKPKCKPDVAKHYSKTEATVCTIGWIPDSEVENG